MAFSLHGCADARFGGVYCSPPLNCLGASGTVDYPKVFNNLYDITHKETEKDRAGKGFVRYDIIGTPQCQLNRRVQIDVPGHKQETLSCDIFNIFAGEYYLPIKRPSRISFKLIGPGGEKIDGKAVTITPNADMISDYGGTEFGWRIIVRLTNRGNLQLGISDPHWIDRN